MALEIAIDELGIGNDKVAYVTLPANKNTVVDAMDRAKIFDEPFARIENCDEFPELNGYEFDEEPTLGELNFLAKRLEEIACDTSEKYAYRALLQKGFNTINEAINRTYNLETIPVYPCRNVYQYGEIVLENEMLEELDNVPDEIYELLDPDKVGRVMAEREGGVFIDGYYAVTSGYEPVIVYDEALPEQLEDWVFRLEVSGIPKRPEDISKVKTEILTLPADEKNMQRIAEQLGEKCIGDCNITKFESSLPQIDDSAVESSEDIYSLNEIAKKYSELSRENTVKFKAVLQNEIWSSIDEAENILINLGGYDFDLGIEDIGDYGEKYLAKQLPPEFDKELLSGIGSVELTRNLLAANGCKFTEYGVVSGYGDHLYATIIAPEQEQKNNFEMGGIT